MVTVRRISAEDWMPVSELAHGVAFGETRPACKDRIDFVIIAEKCGHPVGYITARETDAESVYWQFGGIFGGPLGQMGLLSYLDAINLMRQSYSRITTLIHNSNVVMLKLALKCGFLVTGIKTFEGRTLVECSLEF